MTVEHERVWGRIRNWLMPGSWGCGLGRGILRSAPLWCVLAALSVHSPAAAAEMPPKRIISTAPSVTELLYELGLGERVVGVTTYCHYPPEVRQKPKIGSYMYPNLETMLELRPDLVVILKEHTGLGERIRNVGLNVLELQHNNLAGIYESLRVLGKLAAVEARAETAVEEIRTALEAIGSRARNLPRRGVIFLVGRTPGTIRDLMVAGRGAFLNELIDIAGGRNLFRDSAAFYPKIGLEELYAAQPEVIIDMGDMSDTDQVTEQHKRSVAALWQQYPRLPAVQAGRVYAVANDVFVVPGPRVVEAAAELLRMIHPEAVQ